MKKSKRRPGRGAIVLISSLFVLSALVRLGTDAGVVLAQAVSDTVEKAPGVAVTPLKEPESESEPAPRNRAEIGNLLEALQAREAQVQHREQQLRMRQKALEVADQEIRKRLVELEQVEAELRQTLSLADGAAEGDLARLTTVYENMKGKDAAALFETMEPAFAAGFLGRMRPDAAATIMAGLTPEAAYTISVILAGRNANAPKT